MPVESRNILKARAAKRGFDEVDEGDGVTQENKRSVGCPKSLSTGMVSTDHDPQQTKSACPKEVADAPYTAVKHRNTVEVPVDDVATSDESLQFNLANNAKCMIRILPDNMTATAAKTKTTNEHPLGLLGSLPRELRDEIYMLLFLHVPLRLISQSVSLDLQRLPKALQQTEFEWPELHTSDGRHHFDFLASWFLSDNTSMLNNIANSLVLRGSGQNQPHWFVCACIASHFGLGLVMYPSASARVAQVQPDKSDMYLPSNEADPNAFEAPGIPEDLSNSDFNRLLQQTCMLVTFKTDEGVDKPCIWVTVQNMPDVDRLFAVLRSARKDLRPDYDFLRITIEPDHAPRTKHIHTGSLMQAGIRRDNITKEDFSELLEHYGKTTKSGRLLDIKKNLSSHVLLTRKTDKGD